jgi:ketosteroid isomerase-like protein
MSTENEVRQASAQFYAALNCLMNGNAGPMMEIWSHSPDTTAMQPIGGQDISWEQIRASWEQAAGLFSSGHVTKGDSLIRVGTDLAYEVGIDAVQATVAGETTSFELRFTYIFRREAGGWKLVHQHADIVPAMQAILNRVQAASGQSSS